MLLLTEILIPNFHIIIMLNKLCQNYRWRTLIFYIISCFTMRIIVNTQLHEINHDNSVEFYREILAPSKYR